LVKTEMSDNLIDIKSYSWSEIENYMAEIGQPSYRAVQIFKWLHSGAVSFDEMTDQPKSLRKMLSENAFIISCWTRTLCASSASGLRRTDI